MESTCKADGGEQSHQGSGTAAPGEDSMDCYLRSQGLYRKRVAKDGSCLFRAVAEQVTNCLHKRSQFTWKHGKWVSLADDNWCLKCRQVWVKVTQSCAREKKNKYFTGGQMSSPCTAINKLLPVLTFHCGLRAFFQCKISTFEHKCFVWDYLGNWI